MKHEYTRFHKNQIQILPRKSVFTDTRKCRNRLIIMQNNVCRRQWIYLNKNLIENDWHIFFPGIRMCGWHFVAMDCSDLMWTCMGNGNRVLNTIFYWLTLSLIKKVIMIGLLQWAPKKRDWLFRPNGIPTHSLAMLNDARFFLSMCRSIHSFSSVAVTCTLCWKPNHIPGNDAQWITMRKGLLYWAVSGNRITIFDREEKSSNRTHTHTDT